MSIQYSIHIPLTNDQRILDQRCIFGDLGDIRGPSWRQDWSRVGALWEIVGLPVKLSGDLLFCAYVYVFCNRHTGARRLRPSRSLLNSATTLLRIMAQNQRNWTHVCSAQRGSDWILDRWNTTTDWLQEGLRAQDAARTQTELRATLALVWQWKRWIERW